MDERDEDLSPAEYMAAFEQGEPVDVSAGRPTVIVSSPKPSLFIVSSAWSRFTWGAETVPIRPGKEYQPVPPQGTVSASTVV